MFTGIIEHTGRIEEVITNGTNKTFWIASPVSQELKIDQSVSHNGVCLTVDALKDGMHRVTAIEETLKKTNLGHWMQGDEVNLERCLQMNGRIDGHMVQGHVDTTAKCIGKNTLQGSWEFSFSFDAAYAQLVIEKGSIAINGISLTIFNVTKNEFTVAIIPYTFEHTNMKHMQEQSLVNIEFDVVGKYINRHLSLR